MQVHNEIARLGIVDRRLRLRSPGALGASVRADWSRLSAAGPKPIVEAMGVELGALTQISPRVPSLAYRLCLAARGTIDFAVAGENSHDWDIAAADLMLEEAGGRLVDATGERLVYNGRLVRRRALLAAPEALAPRLLDAFRAATAARPR